jgi:hypothetical protein
VIHAGYPSSMRVGRRRSSTRPSIRSTS